MKTFDYIHTGCGKFKKTKLNQSMFITGTVIQFFPICIALYSVSSGTVFTSSDCLHLYICDLTMDMKVVKMLKVMHV